MNRTLNRQLRPCRISVPAPQQPLTSLYSKAQLDQRRVHRDNSLPIGPRMTEGLKPSTSEASSPKIDAQSLAEMMPDVYDELRRLAANYLRGERSEHTLRRTALVHE